MRNKFGQFVKGHIVSAKCKKASSIANTGKIAWNKNKPMSKVTKRKWLKSISGIPENRKIKIRQKISNSIKNLWKNKTYRENMCKKHRKILNGRTTSHYGYILIYNPKHPFAKTKKRSYVPEHRLVMEKHIGRYLKPKEAIHHINGNHSDNKIENLTLFANHIEHMKNHYPKGSKFGINIYK